jgi:tRNA pseudouridine38-40 synthase
MQDGRLKKIELLLDYDGTAYHGFQWQNNAATIQAALEQAIFQVSGEKLRIEAAGRTDAGVHALGQVAAFATVSSVPAGKWSLALNACLPSDIHIQHSCEMPLSFHPRFQALGKRYIYRIYTGNVGLGLYRRYACCLTEGLDMALMREACAVLIGRHDFRGFCSAKSQVSSFVRQVFVSQLDAVGDCITYSVEADGFLYNMVRVIVGALIGVGRRRLYPGDLAQTLADGQRERLGKTAPPQGLFLEWVRY